MKNLLRFRKKFEMTIVALAALILAFGFVSCENETETDEPTYYTVTFNTDGGSTVEAQSVESGKTATKPADPAKDGYTFAGWYTSADGDTAFDFSTAITADITLTAHWEALPPDTPTYTVTIADGITNGSVSASATSATAGTEITLSATPDSGYKLGAYAVTDASGNAVTSLSQKVCKWQIYQSGTRPSKRMANWLTASPHSLIGMVQ